MEQKLIETLEKLTTSIDQLNVSIQQSTIVSNRLVDKIDHFTNEMSDELTSLRGRLSELKSSLEDKG